MAWPCLVKNIERIFTQQRDFDDFIRVDILYIIASSDIHTSTHFVQITQKCSEPYIGYLEHKDVQNSQIWKLAICMQSP